MYLGSRSETGDKACMNAKSELQVFRTALQRLHRSLLEALRYRLENETAMPVPPGKWLMLLSNDLKYAWVRPLTQLFTEVDILLDEDPFPPEATIVIREKADALFTPNANPFSENFFALMPLEADIMMNYHPFRESLRALAAKK